MNTRLNGESLKCIEDLFKQAVGNETEIKRDDFKKILFSKNPFFTERVFQIFDRDNSGSISLREFLDAIHEYAGQTPDDKFRFLFKVYDIDGDGLIQQQELQNVMQACMEESGMQFSEEQLKNLTLALIEDADSESKDAITYDALKNQLLKHDGLLENLSISLDSWLIPPKSKQPLVSTSLIPYQLTLQYMRNNYVYLTFLALYLFVNAVLFGTRIYQYRNANIYTIFARACGQCLNFNCAFILVLMLRHSITFLRTHGLSSFLPLDQHIYFHKVIGFFILNYSILHTCMHLLNFGTVVIYDQKLNKKNFTLSEWIFTAKPGIFGLIDGYANPTGVILIVILFVMFICSQPFVRRGGCFEIFYWTHLLYVPFFVLLVIHCPNYWKWLLIPGFLYLCERVYRFSQTYSNHGKTYVSTSLLYPSKVTHLVIKRSPYFDFHPGDYVFVNIPTIAKYEWHPFTISSAPEQEDYIWLHIRGVGGWTDRLYSYISEQQGLYTPKKEILSASNSQTFLVDTDESTKNRKHRANFGRTYSGKPTAEAIKVKYKKLDYVALKNMESSNIVTIEGNTSDNVSVENRDEINSDEVPINNPAGKRLEIYLMGPYGAPSSHIFKAKHAVMIATGIGVTPFASILQSIMHRYWKARHTCPKCYHTCTSEIPSTVMHLRKVDFFWINRDQRSFEWFVNLLSQLEIEQAELGETMERFLDMHMYITSALQKTDMKAVGLQLALDLLHEKEKRDLITGLKTRTHAGRPNWDDVFKQLDDQKKGKITVFYCGPPQLSKLLRVKCHKFGFDFRKEVF